MQRPRQRRRRRSGQPDVLGPSRTKLSHLVENGLIEPMRQTERKRWLENNREALDDYNRRIEKHGVFSDDLRRF